MNVVIANENKNIIDRLSIDIIKRIDGEYEVRELMGKLVNLYFNKMIIDITAIKNYRNPNIFEELRQYIDPSKVIILLNSDSIVNSKDYISCMIKAGFYNFSRNFEGINYLYNTPNDFSKVKHFIDDENIEVIPYIDTNAIVEQPSLAFAGKKIIGLMNLTDHAGASTLTNMMVRQLNNHGYKAYGIEMFRQDLIYYRSENLFSCMNKNDLDIKLRQLADAEAVIIDLNEFGEAYGYCDDILYLVEPSYIKLTKLLKKNKNAFLDRKNDKIVLNMSFVNDADKADFEYELKCKIFDIIPPINDRNKNNESVNDVLYKLGFKNVKTM